MLTYGSTLTWCSKEQLMVVNRHDFRHLIVSAFMYLRFLLMFRIEQQINLVPSFLLVS
jgi:hypothetical protein